MHKAHKDGLKTCLSLAEGAAVALRRYLALMPLPDEQANAHLEFVDTLLSRLVDRIGAVKVPLPPPHLAPPSAFLQSVDSLVNKLKPAVAGLAASADVRTLPDALYGELKFEMEEAARALRRLAASVRAAHPADSIPASNSQQPVSQPAKESAPAAAAKQVEAPSPVQPPVAPPAAPVAPAHPADLIP